MSSSSSNSGSSAALATVVVTARDIEFSNYNSATGKWGGAVMTMMILDAVTEELEGYNEKVYAVFRNHDDPTDLIEFSPEVDGLDTRVTTTDPMVASAKYELYKVYGATSGGEYATSSQFYFQAPGKVWDFANDTVGTDDITLVSDWNNYGEIVTATKTYKIADAADLPAMNGKYNFNQNYNWDFTVNGETVNSADVTGIRLTSLVDEAVFPYSRRVDLTRRMDNLEDVDIVSSRITTLYGPCVQKPVHRFAIPETVTNLSNFLRGGNIINTKTDLRTFPMYIPDSVTRLSSFMYGVWEPNKLRMSPNVTNISDGYYREAILAKTHYELPDNATWASGMYIFNSVSQANGDEVSFDLDKNVTSSGNSSYYILGQCYSLKLTGDIVLPGGFGKLNSTINSTNTATSLNKIEFKEGITVLENGVCNMVGYYGSGLGTAQNHTVIKLPNSLTKVSNSCFYYMYKTSYVDFEFGTGLTTMGSDNFAYCRLYGNQIKIPGTVTSIGNGFFHDAYSPNGLDLSELSGPDVVAQQDGFVRSSSKTVNGEGWLEVTVAPGTTDDWAARFPNYYNNSFDWRRINWIEPTTEYGKLVYYPNYTTTWGVSSYAGTRQGSAVKIYSVEEFENWIATLSPAPYVSATGDLRFDSPNGQDLQYVDINGDTQTIQYGVWGIPGVQHLDFDYSAPEKYIVFNNNITISTVDQTSTAEVELTSMAQYNSLCTASGIPYVYNDGPIMDKTTRVTVGANSTVIPIACIKSYEFGTVPTTIPNYFLIASSIETVNMSHANITSIGDGFLADCGNFNAAVDLTNVTSVGTDFLSKCKVFNSSLGNTSNLTSVGIRFLYNCRAFNQPIQVPTAMTSLNWFLSGCYAFNYPLDFSRITTIGDKVLYACKAFNYALDLSSVTSVGEYFLSSCSVYNQPVTIANVTTVGRYFLSNCPALNSTVSLPNCTTFGDYFMSSCTIFNQPFDTSKITNCGYCFLQSCKAFNQSLDLNNLEYTGTSNNVGGFLGHCEAYNKTLNLPKIRYFGGLDYMASFNSNVTFGPYLEKLSMWSFAYNDKMCKTYDFNTVNPNNVQVGSTNYFNSLFVTTNSSTDAYVNGVKIAGTNRSAWMTKCPNNSSGTFTRRLINAGY